MGASAAVPAARSFSEPEQTLLNSMAQRGSPLLDDLMADTGRRADEILPLLMLLELQGVVKTLPGGRYLSLLRD